MHIVDRLSTAGRDTWHIPDWQERVCVCSTVIAVDTLHLLLLRSLWHGACGQATRSWAY